MNARFTVSKSRVKSQFGLLWEVTDNEKGYCRYYRTRKNAEASIASVLAFIEKAGR